MGRVEFVPFIYYIIAWKIQNLLKRNKAVDK